MPLWCASLYVPLIWYGGWDDRPNSFFLILSRYQKSPASFEALARQSAMLSQSDSALFDSDHPSLAGKVLDGITFRELTPEQLGQVRAHCGLQKWDEVDK